MEVPRSSHLQFASHGAIVRVCTQESWMLVFIPHTWAEGYYSVFVMAKMFVWLLTGFGKSVTKAWLIYDYGATAKVLVNVWQEVQQRQQSCFTLSPLVSLVVDQVRHSLCISQDPCVRLKGVRVVSDHCLTLNLNIEQVLDFLKTIHCCFVALELEIAITCLVGTGA